MRRSGIKNAIEQIVADLTESGMQEMFQKPVSQGPRSADSDKGPNWVRLSVVTDYITRVEKYSDEQHEILEILDLSDLSDPNFWQTLVENFEPGFLYGSFQKINNVINFLPKIARIFDQSSVEDKVLIAGAVREVSLQRVILSDEGESFSSPDRLIDLLSSIRDIYSVTASLSGESDETLAVLRIDSGSEKSFDFLGVARLMEQIRETLDSIYRMIAFHRQNVTMKNLEVASDGLEIVRQIEQLKGEGSLNNEDADRLKHKLFGALEVFANTGAYTPEMNSGQLPPALVMRPTPKLLTGPNRPSGEESDPESDQTSETSSTNKTTVDGEFTPEEIEAAVNALRKAKTGTRSEQESGTEPAKDGEKAVTRRGVRARKRGTPKKKQE